MLCDHQVPAFNTCWIAQLLLNSNEVAIFSTSCALTLSDLQSSSEADPYAWLMTDLVQNKMMFQDTCFFLSVNEINRLEIPDGATLSKSYFQTVLIGHSSSLSLSPPMKSSKEGIMNSSNLGSQIEGFWVLATKTGTKKNVVQGRRGYVTHYPLLAEEETMRNMFSRLGAYSRAT